MKQIQSITIVLFLLICSYQIAAIEILNKEEEQSNLPDSFTWGNINGTNYLTYLRNQLAPRLCDSGWAFAVTSSLNDRIKIKRNSSSADIILSPQVLISCDEGSNGCRGGSPSSAYQYILRNNITDETCSPYTATDSRDGYQCTALTKCMECWPKIGCKVRPDGYIYSLEDWGTLQGEENMKEEILKNGPITCVISSTEEFRSYRSGILDPPTSSLQSQINHTLSVVGWGQDEHQTKYWIARNSQGSFWGEDGFINIIRGKNALNIENDCSFGNIKDTWTYLIRNSTNSSSVNNVITDEESSRIENIVLNATQSMLSPFISESEQKIVSEARLEFDQMFKQSFDKYLPLVESFSPSFGENVNVDVNSLPTNFTWADINGINYLTQIRNQHNPQYCGGCWSFAVTSSIQDRIKIARNRTDVPDVILSNQMIINCHYGGSCSTGGVSLVVYYFINKFGVVEDSCMPYQAKDQWLPICSAKQQCISCQLPSSPISNSTTIPSTCPTQTKYPYKKWKVTQFGHIAGVKQMKSEIFARGPISCTIKATDNLENNYTGGIYSEKVLINIPNHFVSVVGWGKTEQGEEYWNVRNSWGTYWGEQGFFRIKMHSDNLGIENGCSWGVPDLSE